jgi:hypothetical protein
MVSLQAAAGDPQGLSAALAAKEEQVKESAAQVEGLRAKLRHLQNQILRGPGAIARVSAGCVRGVTVWCARGVFVGCGVRVASAVPCRNVGVAAPTVCSSRTYGW